MSLNLEIVANVGQFELEHVPGVEGVMAGGEDSCDTYFTYIHVFIILYNMNIYIKKIQTHSKMQMIEITNHFYCVKMIYIIFYTDYYTVPC